MSKRAAIAGSLVDVKNVNVHKSVRLIIDVPAELATTVIEAFGWPTQVNPVSVAVARLDLSNTEKPSKPAQSFATMPSGQQAGMLCSDPTFRNFLAEHGDWQGTPLDAETAAHYVRTHCGVSSRSEIDKNATAKTLWRDLVEDFRGWQRALEVVG